MFEIMPDLKSPRVARQWYWQQFLTLAVFNLVDVTGMDAAMETSYKLNTLVCGRCLFFTDRDGILRCLDFADGGEIPVYQGQIIRYLVTNPVIGEYRKSVDDTDCYAVYLTMLDRCQMAQGFTSIIDMFASDLAENDLTIDMVQFLKRLPVVFTAKSDADLNAVLSMLQSIANGERNIVAQSRLQDMISRLDGGQSAVTPLSEFTEYQQYKIGQFYAMLGVNSVWNLKREHVAASENVTTGETARYNIADIVDGLEQQMQDVNARFGTDFHVVLNVERAAEIAAAVDSASDTDTEPETTDNADGGDADAGS